jgi:hypothetical protein
MSGPIVRKYGFPNFEKIFGERDLQHGVEEGEGAPEPATGEAPAPAAKKGGTKGEKAPKAPSKSKKKS